MAQPTASDIHINFALTNLSVAYLQSERNFIADRVFPIVPVQFKSNSYFLYDRDAWFRSDATERAPSTESAGTGFTVTNATYTARVYSVHYDIAEQIRANADANFNLDREASELVMRQLMIQKESTFITNFFATSKWTGGSGGATDQAGVTSGPGANQFLRWDQAGSTPIEDVQTQILSIAAKTGFRPNKLVLGPYTRKALVNNPEIIDRVKYVQKGFLTDANLAEAFGVDEVLTPMATQNTATEGATLSMSFMYGKAALLVYAAPSPGLYQPSGGYTFAWQNYMPYGAGGYVKVKRIPMLWLESDRIEGSMAYDQKLVAADLGVFFNTAVS